MKEFVSESSFDVGPFISYRVLLEKPISVKEAISLKGQKVNINGRSFKVHNVELSPNLDGGEVNVISLVIKKNI